VAYRRARKLVFENKKVFILFLQFLPLCLQPGKGEKLTFKIEQKIHENVLVPVHTRQTTKKVHSTFFLNLI